MSIESLKVRVIVDPAAQELQRKQAEKAADNRVFSSQESSIGALSGGPLNEDEKRRVQAMLDRVGPAVPTREQQNADIGKAFFSAHQQSINDPSRRVDDGLKAAESEERTQAFVGRLNGAELNEEQKRGMRALIDSASQDEAFLRNRMRGERDVTPEDTLTELREDVGTVGLRHQMQGMPGVSPEDTRAELLDEQGQILAKEERKAKEAENMKLERLQAAMAMTAQQAKQQAGKDSEHHGALIGLGTRAGSDQAFDLRNDMAERMQASSLYATALKETAPDLAERVAGNERENVRIDVAANLKAAQEAEKATVDKALDNQLDDDLRRRMARETEQAGQGLNSVDVQRSGRELDRGDFIMPRQITRNYNEVDGKFFTKDKDRPLVMFEDKGDKLATSTTDKKAIEDMVTLAKAKQWDSLKLSGSQDFRREAWLQAESQGIKTQGFTPKQSDLAALEALRQERSTNSIQPVQERKQERDTQAQTQTQREALAPRHDVNKNQASMHVEATKAIATNMQELQKRPGMGDKSVDELQKLAYWRGIVGEENKLQPKPVQDEALARFDKQAEDPQFLRRLDQETKVTVQERTTERVQTRETHEQSL